MGCRIKEVKLENFGPLGDLHLNNFSDINLIIGGDGSGKTFLLKALYSVVRSLENYRRGDDITPFKKILAHKLLWTYQIRKPGELLTRYSSLPLRFYLKINEREVEYSISSESSKSIRSASTIKKGKDGNSVYLPGGEILSLFHIIMESREENFEFGFDDTYYDLAKALLYPVPIKANKSFIKYNLNEGGWMYFDRECRGNQVSDESKKISVFRHLVSNGYLSENSILFIDDIESYLHPEALNRFLDCIKSISEIKRIQVFITTNSYHVLENLRLTEEKTPGRVSLICLHEDMADWKNNSITEAFCDLCEERG